MDIRAQCPECDSWLSLKLIPARVVRRARRPDLCGPGSGSYEEVTPRTVTWDCPNPKCDQRVGFPKIGTRDLKLDLPNIELDEDLLEKLQGLIPPVSDSQEETD